MDDSVRFWIGTAIFLLTYLGIAFEKRIKINKTAMALLGSSLMLFFILSGAGGHHEEKTILEKGAAAIDSVALKVAEAASGESHETKLDPYSENVDFNVIFLLAGMMVIVNILRKTGIFQYLAIWSAKVVRGHPMGVLLLLVTVTAVLSSCLDNVTTVLLIGPVTLLVAEQLGVNALIFLLPEVIASNIGGTATLIGDPPNILIGSYASLDFLAFLFNLTPVVVVVMGIYVAGLYVFLKNHITVGVQRRAQIMELNEKKAITNPKLLKKTGIVLAFTMLGFMLHGVVHIDPGVIAMGGAAILMVITRSDVEKTLEEVEWTTLFFFMGLFIVVNGAIEVGFIDKLSSGVLNIMGDSPYNAALIVLWGSAICAGVMNNVSFTAAALPIVKNIIDTMGYEGTPMAASFWWALALGACLGGNLTPVGAAANVLTMDFAERNGHPVSFGKFMKWSIPITIISLIVATGWVSFLIWRAS